MKNTIKITRTDNMTVKQRDTIIRDKNTINLTGEVTSTQRIRNRVINRRKNKAINFMPKIAAGLLLLAWIFISIGYIINPTNAQIEEAKKELLEKTPLEQLLEEVPEIKEIIKDEENPSKSYEEFMEEWERLHKIKYEDQKKNNIEKTTLKWNWRTYNVQVWNDRVKTMKELGYSQTRILDLLAIMNMECWNYKGNCFNWNDIWPMQINKIHKEQYNKSWEIYNRKAWGELFEYQIKYANGLVESYEANNCKPEYVEKYWIGATYNQKRWRCVAFHYNGHPTNKFAYNKLGWERREIIKNIILKK